jgi:hypothetical protein
MMQKGKEKAQTYDAEDNLLTYVDEGGVKTY